MRRASYSCIIRGTYEEEGSRVVGRSLLEDVPEDRVIVTATPSFAGFARFGAAQ
jgi:hypothetical protein